MAVFGFQLIFTGICALMLQKLFPVFSPGLNILLDKIRFLVPSESDLKKQATNKASKDLRISNTTELTLQCHPIIRTDVSFLPYFGDFEWLVNFGFLTVFVHCVIETYFELGFGASSKVHMGVLWCVIEVYLLLSVLMKLVRSYAKTSESGDIGVILALSSLAFVLSMAGLIGNKYLDFELGKTYVSFEKNLKEVFEHAGFESYRSPNEIIFNLGIALVATVVCSVMTFPGIKSAQAFSQTYEMLGIC